MNNLLLNLAAFAVGAHGLIVGAVLLTVPLNFDGSYVDDGSLVVFIFDTTSLASSAVVCKPQTVLSGAELWAVACLWRGG
jgi:hypothetical protein